MLSPLIIKSSMITSQKGFKASLNPGAIGIKCTAHELLEYSIKYKFKAISPLLGDLIKLDEIEKEAYLNKMKKNKIVFDSAGLPIEFRTSEAKFQKGYEFSLFA